MTSLFPAGEHRPPAPFIVGTGRCGTTLLRLMLDKHPHLAIPPETHFPYTLFSEMGTDEKAAEQFLFLMLGSHRQPWFRLDSDKFRSEIRSILPFHVSEGLRLFYNSYANRFHKNRWGDKTPIYSQQIEKIAKILPESYFIHIIRDGRDVAVSLRFMKWGPGNDIIKLANLWRDRIQRTRNLAKDVPHFLEVRYEELVTTPERVLTLICEFLRLEYDRTMLDYYLTSAERLSENEDLKEKDSGGKASLRSRRSAYSNSMTAKPPTTSQIGRRKHELTGEEIAIFHSLAGVMLEELSYDT